MPVALSSSKTVAEMSELRLELRLPESPFISENAGVIHWPDSFLPQNEAVAAPVEQTAAVVDLPFVRRPGH